MVSERIECIAAILAEEGNAFVSAPYAGASFTREQQVDLYVGDLEVFPHAFVLGCVLDRQVRSSMAWRLPYLMAQEIGPGFQDFEKLSRNWVRELIRTNLGRYYNRFTDYVFDAIERIRIKYDGNASQIWKGSPKSATLVKRFIQFKGIGPKIASMASNILYRDFKVKVSDTMHIDISPDIQVRRVFYRTGIIDDQKSVDETILSARELNPVYPGLIDLPTWNIGNEICRPKEPKCSQCKLEPYCLKQDVRQPA